MGPNISLKVNYDPQQQEAHLYLGVEMPEDIVDLILEASGQHLVGLVQHELLDVVGPDNNVIDSQKQRRHWRT